jgi:hypothetical protein
MNQIKFYRAKGGKVEERRVKVSQPSNRTLTDIENGAKHIVRNKTAPLPTVAQAEDRMLREGWSRKKPKLPVALKAAA